MRRGAAGAASVASGAAASVASAVAWKTIPGYGRRAAACDRTILHLRGPPFGTA
jgi:hypothetical protein